MDLYWAGALEQVRDESVRRLDDGGLPVLAERRLAAFLGSGAGRFTTHQPVAAFALTRSVGLRPITQVMGACVFHARVALGNFGLHRYAQRAKPYGLQGPAEPWNDGRERALARMTAEARLCGADAVVGVGIRQTQQRMPSGNDASVETVATGTAVARKGHPADAAGPILTSLSAADYWKLLQLGYAAVGIVASTTVYGSKPDGDTITTMRSTRWSDGRRWTRELPEFSAVLRLAHRAAFQDMHGNAERMGASGIVGVTIDRQQYVVTPKGSNYPQFIVVVHALGTAITGDGTPPASASPLTFVGGATPSAPGSPLIFTPVRHLDDKDMPSRDRSAGNPAGRHQAHLPK
jgi:uncharacterized protein YbjQ (UPF0145 family)